VIDESMVASFGPLGRGAAPVPRRPPTAQKGRIWRLRAPPPPRSGFVP